MMRRAIWRLGILMNFTLTATIFAGPSQLGLREWLRGYGDSGGFYLPQGMRINHFVSVGVTSSSSGSLMQSLYGTMFTYPISRPLTLYLNVGVGSERMMGKGAPAFNQSHFIGGAILDYRPLDNVFFRFEIQRGPSFFTPERPFGMPGYRGLREEGESNPEGL